MVVVTVVNGCNVDELVVVLMGGGELSLEVVTLEPWFVVDTVSSLVTDGGVVRVPPDLVGAVDTAAGGTEEVDGTRSLVLGSSD